MRKIDTDVLVRLLAGDDAAQTRRAERFLSEGAWIPLLVLAESVWVLESVYGLGKPHLQTALSMLLVHCQLVLQDATVIRAAPDDFAVHQGVGFTDCLVVAVAWKNGDLPVGTFDRKLARLAGVQAL